MLHLLLACAPGADSTLGSATIDTTLAIADFPACEPLPAGTELDLDARTALGVGAASPYSDFEAALGAPAECDGSSFNDDVVCEWTAGLRAYFEDLDADGVPDPGGAPGILYVEETFTGASPDGLGIGVSLGCWVSAYGNPDEMQLERVGDEMVVSELEYDERGFTVRTSGTPDGLADTVVLYD